MGSSPHTRDKFFSSSTSLSVTRIIPAYAGQMCLDYGILCPKWDHPRIRGTNLKTLSEESCNTGSSPHTRDKLSPKVSLCVVPGIIPAYAGQIFFL